MLYTCYEKCKLGSSSSSSFDLLIQHYVRSRIGLDGVLVFRFMKKVGLLPQVRTLSALLHGLVHCRHYGLVMEVFRRLSCFVLSSSRCRRGKHIRKTHA